VKILKLIIGSFIILFVIITIISLFIPSNVQISKAVEINAEKKSIYQQLIDPNKWYHWYPASDSIKVFYLIGEPKGIVIDNLKLELTGSDSNQIRAKYSSSEATKEMETTWKLIPGQQSVAVQWSMNFHLHWYPWEKFSSLLLEKRYGPVMETGLNNLKNYMESGRSSKK
jgi:polyketide cyclase/dehydrase/lipid transport protein